MPWREAQSAAAVPQQPRARGVVQVLHPTPTPCSWLPCAPAPRSRRPPGAGVRARQHPVTRRRPRRRRTFGNTRRLGGAQRRVAGAQRARQRLRGQSGAVRGGGSRVGDRRARQRREEREDRRQHARRHGRRPASKGAALGGLGKAGKGGVCLHVPHRAHSRAAPVLRMRVRLSAAQRSLIQRVVKQNGRDGGVFSAARF